jgi:hypothetical protein
MMTALSLAIAQIVVGLVESLFGRKFFWLFVAIGGFLVGWFLAPAIWNSLHSAGGLPQWERLVIGLASAVVLGFAAFKFTRIMVSVAGFLIFATATILVVRYFGGDGLLRSGTRDFWVVFACGGLAGAVILGLLFDWALIVLTALFGAGAAADGIMYFLTPENPTTADPGPAKWIELVVVGVIFVIGLAVQIMMKRRRLVGKRS